VPRSADTDQVASPGRLDRASRMKIGRELRSMYEPVVESALPRQLLELVPRGVSQQAMR
jgi:hypothetical protein